MRILKEPKVYLIARSQIIWSGIEEFEKDCNIKWERPADGSNAEQLIEFAGRCCYMSFGDKAVSKSNKAYLDNLIGINCEGPAHGSVTEHACFSFLIVGAGRGFSHEQVRHRVGVAYSQLSTRYCDFERAESEDTWEPRFTIPPMAQLSQATELRMHHMLQEFQNQYRQILQCIMEDLEHNNEFMDGLQQYPPREQKRLIRKAARGAARDILPIATEAIMTISMNPRTIWNTVYLRANEHAEAVIRNIYVQIAKIMEIECPNLFSGLEYKTLWDGSQAVILPKDKL